MMIEEGILLNNIKEFLKEAKTAKMNKSFNSSVTLFFKALAVISDYYILKKEGFIPKSHLDRFNVLRLKYRDIYDILNKDFPIYQQSYRIKMNKEYSDVLENDIKKLISICKIKISY